MKKGTFGVLMVLALLATTVGAYVVTSAIGSSTTIEEPITTSDVALFTSTMYPGQTNTYTFTVSNAAPDVSYTITLIPTLTLDSGVNAQISSVTVDGTEITPDANGNYVFTIGAGLTSTVDVTIQTTTDSAPGTVSLVITVDRS